ncbi:MAG: hypothetical protein WCF65_08425 [Parachlamydiaceae bacterium]
MNDVRLSSLLEKLAVTARDHFIAHAEEITAAAQNPDKDQRQLLLRAAFAPISPQLVDLVRSPSAREQSGLPVAIPFHSFLEKYLGKLQGEIIPDVLVEMYLDTTVWTRQIHEKQESIREKTGTNYIPESCRILGKLVADIIPTSMTLNHQEVVSGIYEATLKYLRKSGKTDELSVESYLRQHASEIQGRLHMDFLSFFAPDNVGAPCNELPTAQFMEAAFLKIFDGLTTRIEEKQKDKNYLVKLTTSILDQVGKNFEALNEVAAEAKSSILHDGLHDQFVKKLEAKGLLHPAVAKSPDALEAHKKIRDTIALLDSERELYGKLTKEPKRLECNRKLEQAQKDLDIIKKEIDEENRLHPGIQSSQRVLEAQRKLKKTIGVLELERRLYDKLRSEPNTQECQNRIEQAKKELKIATEIENKETLSAFKVLTRRILEIGGIKSKKDLPFPSQLQEDLWPLLVDDFLPQTIQSLFSILSEPLTRDKMLIGGLKSLIESLDASEGDDTQNTTEAPEDPTQQAKAQVKLGEARLKRGEALIKQGGDSIARGEVLIAEGKELIKEGEAIISTQRYLDIALGKFIQAAVQLVPTSVVKAVFGIDALTIMTAELLGKKVRQGLNRHTTLQWADQGMASAMLNLHPGKWETEQVDNDMIIPSGFFDGEPLVVVGAEEGPKLAEFHAEPLGELNFSSPYTQDGVEIAARQKLADEKISHEEAKRLLVQAGRSGVSLLISSFFKLPLQLFDFVWKHTVNRVFGKYADNVRNYFVALGKKTVFRVIEMILSVASLPIRKAFWFFIDLYIGRKTRHLPKVAQIDIIKNIIFVGITTVLDSLEGDIKPVTLSPADLAQVERLDTKEHMDVNWWARWFERWAEKAYPQDSPQAPLPEAPEAPQTAQ